MPKKLWTLMLKGFQNEAKMDAEINGYWKKRPQNMPKSSKYQPNVSQGATKMHKKIDLRFWTVFWASKGGSPSLSLDPFWRPLSIKNSKKGIKKDMQNSMPKTYRKMMAKGSQNDAKIDSKIDENSYFSEKGWKARNYLFYNRKRGSGHLKSHQNSI